MICSVYNPIVTVIIFDLTTVPMTNLNRGMEPNCWMGILNHTEIKQIETVQSTSKTLEFMNPL